jgi:serine/threonine protein kinase
MAPTLDQFCSDLAETGFLSEEGIREVIASLPPERKPREAPELIRELVRLHKLTVYQAQEIYRGRAKRLHLGNYVVLDKIGQGGMGIVLKAEHKRMRRIVALKVIRPRSIESASALKRFHREVEAAAQLIHTNIVTAFDADEAEGTHFLVMEFVDGTDLSTLVKLDGPLPLETALSCVLQAALGLEYAHSKGIIHRDIKPRNLLLDRQGKIKILDMGLARVETSSGADQSDLTGSGQIMGTIDYMAPEQAVNPKNADQRADIYSLGITLWYLLVGRLPFSGETVLEKLVAHREDPVPSLAAVRRDVSRELDAVFERMVAKKPHHRYATMTELIADLEQCRVDPTAPATISVEPDQGSELKAFLKGMSSGSGVRRAAEIRNADRPRPKTAPITGETIADGESADDTDLTFENLRRAIAAEPHEPLARAAPESQAAPTKQALTAPATVPELPPAPQPIAAPKVLSSPQTTPPQPIPSSPRRKQSSLPLAIAVGVAAFVVVALALLAIAALSNPAAKRPPPTKSTAERLDDQREYGPPRLTRFHSVAAEADLAARLKIARLAFEVESIAALGDLDELFGIHVVLLGEDFG